MKKVFLFLTASLFGFAAMAGEWELDEVTNSIEIPWNSYGTGNGTTDGSYQWQAGNAAVLPDAVEVQTGNSTWVPAVGEKFMVTFSAVPDFTSDKVQMFIIDERDVAAYWSALSSDNAEFAVTAGEEFSITTVFKIDNVTKVTGGDGKTIAIGSEVEGGLTSPDLVIGLEKPGFWVNAADKSAATSVNCTFNNVKLEILYSEAGNYTNPVELSYIGAADVETDGYKYQAKQASAVTSVTVGEYVNVEFSGKAISDVTTLMYGLVDGSEAAGWWTVVTGKLTTFASNIVAGDNVDFKFSLPISVAASEAPDFLDVFLAQDANQEMSKVFDNAVVKVTTGAKLYSEPATAIEEVAAEDVLVNGVIYAESIVVYNAAGQVVAEAAESFAIDALPAGVYFAKTSKGAFSFSK